MNKKQQRQKMSNVNNKIDWQFPLSSDKITDIKQVVDGLFKMYNEIWAKIFLHQNSVFN